MTIPILNYWFDWGEKSPLWPKDFDLIDTLSNPADLRKLGLSEDLIREIEETAAWHNTALNWNYPPDPSPWRQEECDRFNKKARELFENISKELEGRFIVIYEAGEEREDPDLDEYLKDPYNFRRKDDDSAETTRQPEFREWRISRLKRLRIVCILAVPIGLYLGLPLVWILAIIGIVTSSIKLKKLK
ncbi:hypothetical protein LLG95_04105 [bacterium]|nr:hypothetical protein [bacterium]